MEHSGDGRRGVDPPPVPQVGSQGIQRKSLLVCSCWNVRIDLGLQEAGDVPMGVLPPGTFLPDLPVSQGPVRAVRMGMGGVRIAQRSLVRTQPCDGPLPSAVKSLLQPLGEDPGDHTSSATQHPGSGPPHAHPAVQRRFRWSAITCANCEMFCACTGGRSGVAVVGAMIAVADDPSERPDGYCPAFGLAVAVKDRVTATAQAASGAMSPGGMANPELAVIVQEIQASAASYLTSEEANMQARIQAYAAEQRALFEALRTQTARDVAALSARVRRIRPMSRPKPVEHTANAGPPTVRPIAAESPASAGGDEAGRPVVATSALRGSLLASGIPQQSPLPPPHPLTSRRGSIDQTIAPKGAAFSVVGRKHRPNLSGSDLTRTRSTSVGSEPDSVGSDSEPPTHQPLHRLHRRRTDSESSATSAASTGSGSAASLARDAPGRAWRRRHGHRARPRRSSLVRDAGSLPAIFSLDEELDPQLMRKWQAFATEHRASGAGGGGVGRTRGVSDDDGGGPRVGDDDDGISSADGHAHDRSSSYDRDVSASSEDSADDGDSSPPYYTGRTTSQGVRFSDTGNSLRMCRGGRGRGRGSGRGSGASAGLLSTSAPIAISRQFRMRGAQGTPAVTVPVPGDEVIPEGASPEAARSLAMSFRDQAWHRTHKVLTASAGVLETIGDDEEDEEDDKDDPRNITDTDGSPSRHVPGLVRTALDGAAADATAHGGGGFEEAKGVPPAEDTSAVGDMVDDGGGGSEEEEEGEGGGVARLPAYSASFDPAREFVLTPVDASSATIVAGSGSTS